MHDPQTVAHDIRWPKWLCRSKTYQPPILTIWHVDPERDGTDDSCGWFKRSRHCDQAKLDTIAKDFLLEWTHGVPQGWFNANGDPNYSPLAITMAMFRIATNVHFGHWSSRAERFLRKHCFEILRFGENSCDSLYTFITRPYGKNERDTPERRAREAACIVYPWIVRAAMPWWRHPRWHFWHWRFQFHPWQDLKRRWWDKCAVCGKRGFKEPAIGNWDGNKIWHQSCDAANSPDCRE